jgi:tetratricopeptide (TPR) repeat protein
VRAALLLVLTLGCTPMHHIPPPSLPQAEARVHSSPPAKALQHYALAVLAWQDGDHAAAQEHLGIALLFDPNAPSLHLARGRLAMEQGELATARASLVRAINLDPSDAKARLQLVRLLEIRGEYSAAVRQLETILDQARSDLAYSDLVQLHLMLGQRAQAAAVMEQWAAQPPEHPGWLQGRAALRLELDQADAAWHDLAQLLEGDLAGGPALDLLLEATKQARRYGSTLALLEQVTLWEPGNEEMVVRLGGLAEQAGDHRLAAQAWSRLDTLRGGMDASVKLMMAQAFLDAGDAQAALVAVDAALALGEDPKLVGPVHVRAMARTGQLDQALALLEAQPGWERDPSTLRLRGELLEAAGHLPEARDALRSALDVAPSSWSLAWTLASLEARTGGLEEARALVDRVPDPVSAEPDKLLIHATLLHEAGQVDDALALVEESEGRWPDHPPLAHARVIWLGEHDPDGARAAARAAVGRMPGDPSLVQQLALLEHEAGEAAAARELLGSALLAHPDHPHLLNDLAYLSAQAGDHSDTVLAMARRAVDQRPASGAFQDTLGWILWQRGEGEEALRVLQRAQRLSPEDPTIHAHLDEARAGGAAEAPQTR